MKRVPLLPLFLLTICLSACASGELVTPFAAGLTQSVGSPSTSTTTTPPAPPDITPTFEGCAYNWASHALPELSQKFNEDLLAVDSNITGSAYAYGEDCTYADGHSTFSAMETDFRVKVGVTDLKDEKKLGDRISQVMTVITKLPVGDISGGNPGRVEFDFINSESENLFLNVSIAIFDGQASGLTGADLFKFLNNYR